MSVLSTSAWRDAFDPAERATPATSESLPARTARHGSGEWLVYAPLVVTTIFSKFSIPPLGERGLGVGLPLIFLALATGVVLGRVHIHPGRACLYALTVATLGLLQIVNAQPFSLSS